MLTEKCIHSLVVKAVSSGRRLCKSDGANGLFLRVSPKGRVLFTFMFYDAGRHHREKSIGTYPMVSLRQAGKTAEGLSKALAEGDLYSAGSPLKITARELYDRWLRVKRSRVELVTVSKIEVRAEKYILSRFGNTAFDELSPSDFFEEWREPEESGRPETLMRLCLIVKEMYAFGVNTGRLSLFFRFANTFTG